ncbi:invasion protein, partial [Campylobacter coli]|nr:invasion protein [Campylobacter coli]
KTIKHTEDSMMKEEDVLLYFSKNKTLTLEFKEIFNKELKYIKQSHPNIAASWKYYQKFEKICEELDKKE